MAKSSKDIQLSELKDTIAQLNTTIKLLTDIIAQKDKALVDMQTRIEETSKRDEASKKATSPSSVFIIVYCVRLLLRRSRSERYPPFGDVIAVNENNFAYE